MKAFRFSLAPVLRQREMEEERRKKEFADVMRRLTAAKESRARLEKKLDECHATISGASLRLVDIDEIRACHAFIEQINRELKNIDLMLAKLHIELERRRAALTAAVIEKKKFEKLREREMTEFDAELRRQEQKSIDETSITRFIHGYESQA